MRVEGFERDLKVERYVERIKSAALLAPPLRHLFADVVPQVAKPRHLVARDVVRDRDPGELNDPALDGVHQGEVAHCPGEEGPLGVARAAKEEGGGGEIQHARNAKLPLHGLEPRDPHPRRFGVLFCLLAVVAGELPFFVFVPPAVHGSSGAPRR